MLNTDVGGRTKSGQFGDWPYFVQLIILNTGRGPSCHTQVTLSSRGFGEEESTAIAPKCRDRFLSGTPACIQVASWLPNYQCFPPLNSWKWVQMRTGCAIVFLLHMHSGVIYSALEWVLFPSAVLGMLGTSGYLRRGLCPKGILISLEGTLD